MTRRALARLYAVGLFTAAFVVACTAAWSGGPEHGASIADRSSHPAVVEQLPAVATVVVAETKAPPAWFTSAALGAVAVVALGCLGRRDPRAPSPSFAVRRLLVHASRRAPPAWFLASRTG